MIIVRVELWSAITGKRTELARMSICNTGEGENPRRGDYSCATFKGRDEATLQAAMVKFFTARSPSAASGVTRKGEIKDHARLDEHVWNLVAKALSGMGYGARK